MTRRAWHVAVVGITGAVGREMVRALHVSPIEIASLRGFASTQSAGKRLDMAGRWGEGIEILDLTEERLDRLDLVLLSAGARISREWVPRIVAKGAWAVDNSSAFRMDPEAALIVPEVNAGSIPEARGIVANPNCSTIQMVVVLAPLVRRFALRRVHVATYQSVSGRGQKGIDALRQERLGRARTCDAFPHRIDRNVIPQCDVFVDGGWTREEVKMIRETRRILDRPDLAVHPTCVRVPVEIAHSEALHLEFEHPVSSEEIRSCLQDSPGIRIQDDPSAEDYPTPIDVAGKEEVWVGRIRTDESDPRIAALWVVADNLTKGAATNAVQIATLLYRREASDADVSSAPRI
jgi:aspartate-semialdehyde dehydrogenase